MKRMRHIFQIGTLLTALMAVGCADNDRQQMEEQLPEGYGRLAITISTPEAVGTTRAVNTTTSWLQGTEDERSIKSYHLLICQGNAILQTISGSTLALSDHEADSKNYFPTADVTSDILPVGTYNFTFYCLANFTGEMVEEAGLTLSGGKITDTTLPTGFETKVVRLPLAFNGSSTLPSTGMPRTGKLTASDITIGQGTTTIAAPLILWRMMAKLEFRFKNESNTTVDINGIEVEPINLASEGKGIYLFSKDNLWSLSNLAPQYVDDPVNETGVTATWALHENNIQTQATPSIPLFSIAELAWGHKLESTGNVKAQDAASTILQKFKAIEKVTQRDEEQAIILSVKPRNGLSFKPTKLSFKACRGGTNSGKFDVVTVSGATTTTLATAIIPERYNEGSFISAYEYDLNSTASSGVFFVKIYLYTLNKDAEYAFSDFVITGEVKNADGATQEGVTLPYGALSDVGTVKYETSPVSPLLTIAAGKGSTTTSDKSLYFYVNETDATFTTTENQYSVRFRIQRNGHDEEFRYGLTTAHDGSTGGFNVIRRNDWIHIPVTLTDWQMRLEAMPFVPIAGYPAVLLGSDGLTATFSTGGFIILQPFVRKNDDGTWRDFSDPEVTFQSISWKNSDGTDVSGDGKILTQPFAYDAATQCITGQLSNSLPSGTHKTTLTINVKLGATGSQYDYSFSCNIILQK